MLRVVVVVQEVMECTRMLRVRTQHPVEDPSHLRLDLAARQRLVVAFVGIHVSDEAARHCPEQRERVERGHVRIVG